jgi:hypothetical protein
VRVLDGVGEQVGEDLADAIAVHLRLAYAGKSSVDGNLPFFGDGLVKLGHLVDEPTGAL